MATTLYPVGHGAADPPVDEVDDVRHLLEWP